MAESEVQFDPPISGVVVGHDGAERGDRALAWALADATRRQAPLHVIRAWLLSTAVREVGAPFGTVPSYDDCERAITKGLAASLDALGPVPPSVPVHQHVIHGPAAQALIAASKSADLLVVGDRGRGGFAGLLLGSTAEQVLRHARCPVVVVHG